MKYEGPLYGKIGRRYIKLTLTSSDVDNMEKCLKRAEAEKELFQRIFTQLHFDGKIEEFISQTRPLFPEQLGPAQTSFKIDQP